MIEMRKHPRVVCMTADHQMHLLEPYAWLLNKYWVPNPPVLVCGFSEPKFDLPSNFSFWSIGNFDDFPAHKWSDAFIRVLDHLNDELFILMLEDYFIYRQVDTLGITMLADYMRQFTNVLRIDLQTDRLYAKGGGQYLFDYRTYGYCGHLDLIKSDPDSEYHLSLWGSMWRKELLKRFIIHGERAQTIELAGTRRLQEVGDELLVLGTRQAPLKHTNIYGGGWIGPDYSKIQQGDLDEFRRRGWYDERKFERR